tara:strand:+ start:302 stop:559 length:258 start_codon:yes stop_codon:yes gene_type:complete
MNQIVKFEKRFENAFEKLELALENKNVRKVSNSVDQREKVITDSHYNIDDLLHKVEQLERAAENDAEEIDKLVTKLKKILETGND